MRNLGCAAIAVLLAACARGGGMEEDLLPLEPTDPERETTSVKVPEAPDVDAGASLDAAADAALDAPPPPPPPSCTPCTVTGPGTFCGVTVGISPYATGGPFGGFQSTSGTGAQTTITVTFSSPVPWVSVTALDPDFGGNQLRAFDAMNTLVATVPFDVDGTPGAFTTSAKAVTASVARIALVPDPADYLAYDTLQIRPPGCP
jgi:hypothetical protein